MIFYKKDCAIYMRISGKIRISETIKTILRATMYTKSGKGHTSKEQNQEGAAQYGTHLQEIQRENQAESH